jgi:hypothetical protein
LRLAFFDQGLEFAQGTRVVIQHLHVVLLRDPSRLLTLIRLSLNRVNPGRIFDFQTNSA